VRRRIFLVAAVVAGSSLGALGVGIVSASGSTVHYVKKTLNCNVFMTVVPPKNTPDEPTAPITDGIRYGQVKCNNDNLDGVVRDSFSTDVTSGNEIGSVWEYFPWGRLTGHANLVPQAGGTFTQQSWTGILKFTGGTGAYNGVQARKPYTFDCSTNDSVHVTCTQTSVIYVQQQ
jgi:hypothetical protein